LPRSRRAASGSAGRHPSGRDWDSSPPSRLPGLRSPRKSRFRPTYGVARLATYEKITYGVSDHIATIAMDDGETRNSLSWEMLTDLTHGFEAARDDEDVRVVLLTSTHEKVFSSGGNLSGFAGDTPTVHKQFANERFVNLFELIGTLGNPTICAVGGHCLAGSLGIALACDLIIA